jgi:5'-nucleotidase
MRLKLLALAVAGTLCQASFACTPGTFTENVLFGSTDAGVPNRILDANCASIDSQIRDEDPWGNQAAFIAHVSTVTMSLQKAGRISALERARLLTAARTSQIGTTLKVKLIAFNDFHGYIKPFEGSGSNPGVTRFSTRIKELKAQNPLHAVVSAGDMIGASPLTSALFKDEPTIEAMNRIGIDFNAVGNHEFDEGKDELLRMQHGGNHPDRRVFGSGHERRPEGRRVRRREVPFPGCQRA